MPENNYTKLCEFCHKPLEKKPNEGNYKFNRRRFCNRLCASWGEPSGYLPLEDRFWGKVNKDGPIPTACPWLGCCWLWTGKRQKSNGVPTYGSIWTGNGLDLAHRVAYRMKYGNIPEGLHILHHCDTPPCVRWLHLYAGTVEDNVRDMMQRNRWRTSSRLTDEIVKEIRSRYATGEILQKSLADKYGVHQATISNIVLGKTFKHI